MPMRFNQILLIEDDSSSSFLSQLIIKALNLAEEVIQAGDGQAALDLLLKRVTENEFMPDVILLDVDMPQMNGITFIQHLSHHSVLKQLIPRVILLTGGPALTQIETAQALGVHYCLLKPMTVGDIIPVLRDLQGEPKV
jgi:CheY-like chemotaxis protein